MGYFHSPYEEFVSQDFASHITHCLREFGDSRIVTGSNGGGAERRNSSLADSDFVHKTVTNGSQDPGRYIGARYCDAVLATI